MKGRTKLKKMKLTSVDMCRRGANPDAYINLHKNVEEPPAEEPVDAGIVKAIVDGLKAAFGLGDVDKKATTFDDNMKRREIQDNRWQYADALHMSIESILEDETLSDDQKVDMMKESIAQFAEVYGEMCAQLITVSKAAPEGRGDGEGNGEGKPSKDNEKQPEGPKNDSEGKSKKEGDEEMKIDKSKFTPAELEQYEALIAKGLVDDGEPAPADESVTKALNDAMAEVEELKKKMEINELEAVAKKYEVLGKKGEDLVDTLYTLKKSSPDAYDKYVALMDEQLEMVNKSGLFGEIGKSNHVAGGADAVSKIENIASDIQKADPSMTRLEAINKAWEQHPELVAEYEENYK